jgi:predicted dehydrogenase
MWFVEMRGTKAGFKWENGGLTMFTDGVIATRPMSSEKENAHTTNIRHYIKDVLINGKPPIFVPEQGVNMIKILTSIYKSAETGKEVLL